MAKIEDFYRSHNHNDPDNSDTIDLEKAYEGLFGFGLYGGKASDFLKNVEAVTKIKSRQVAAIALAIAYELDRGSV